MVRVDPNTNESVEFGDVFCCDKVKVPHLQVEHAVQFCRQGVVVVLHSQQVVLESSHLLPLLALLKWQ